jgi:hypothetical protein
VTKAVPDGANVSFEPCPEASSDTIIDHISGIDKFF